MRVTHRDCFDVDDRRFRTSVLRNRSTARNVTSEHPTAPLHRRCAKEIILGLQTFQYVTVILSIYADSLKNPIRRYGPSVARIPQYLGSAMAAQQTPIPIQQYLLRPVPLAGLTVSSCWRRLRQRPGVSIEGTSIVSATPPSLKSGRPRRIEVLRASDDLNGSLGGGGQELFGRYRSAYPFLKNPFDSASRQR